TPIGLLAVIGPSRNDQRVGASSFLCRYCSTTLPAPYHHASRSRSMAGKSTRVSTCLKVAVALAMSAPFGISASRHVGWSGVVIEPRSSYSRNADQPISRHANKKPALTAEDGRTRGTTSVGRAARGPLGPVRMDPPPAPPL